MSAVDFAASELRKLILSDQIPLDERLTESSGAAILGLSRTPLREALSRLEREGLIEKLNGRGYKVRSFGLQDIKDASDLRGLIEGYAAGRMAAKGPSDAAKAAIEASIEKTGTILDGGPLGVAEIGIYQEANAAFHSAILSDCGNRFVADSLQKVQQFPILTPGAFAKLGTKVNRERLRLTVGHSQHVIIWDAIQNRDAIRAENAMREHAQAPLRYAELFLGAEAQHLFPEAVVGNDAL